MFHLITPQKFTAEKNAIAYLKGHKICFLGKKNNFLPESYNYFQNSLR